MHLCAKFQGWRRCNEDVTLGAKFAAKHCAYVFFGMRKTPLLDASKVLGQDDYGAKSAGVRKQHTQNQCREGMAWTHPQYPQIGRLPSEVAAKSAGQDGVAKFQ